MNLCARLFWIRGSISILDSIVENCVIGARRENDARGQQRFLACMAVDGGNSKRLAAKEAFRPADQGAARGSCDGEGGAAARGFARSG